MSPGPPRTGQFTNLFVGAGFSWDVHAESPPNAPPGPSGAEWAIGIGFVLAALALVGYIGLTLLALSR